VSPLWVPRTSLLSDDSLDSLLEESLPWPPPPERPESAGAQADKSNDRIAVVATRAKRIRPQ
jgi:hypothetical protein